MKKIITIPLLIALLNCKIYGDTNPEFGYNSKSVIQRFVWNLGTTTKGSGRLVFKFRIIYPVLCCVVLT
ncbi:hypothetical protein I3843_05G125300 [Carya illinoinensis]|uniref:Uncharacterized protein n=1 Tax=Carya illinoinensis TaxID=32201 RepID=A0A922ES53_CARIL|nr:hypothetical protein I3760_02G134600 [Carya illinoinensis]KAG6709171.1 hypothetical protein I3842_06G118800 [Carya illinoinensis]KAG7979322.1 hypothetical protein I3843_05G125300 [Carya illinoinensis]